MPVTEPKTSLKHTQYKEILLCSDQKTFLLLDKKRICKGDTFQSYCYDICAFNNPKNQIRSITKYKIVGFIRTTIRNKTDQNRPGSFDIDKIEVFENYRRRGYAQSALINIIFRYKAHPDIQQFWLEVEGTNTGAIDLYTKLGFKIIGHHQSLETEDQANSKVYVIMNLPCKF